MEIAEDKIDLLVAGINRLVEETCRARAQDDDLWEAKHIGDYLKLSKGAVQNKILNAPGFPTPVILPSGGRRWVAKEVKAYLLRRRGY